MAPRQRQFSAYLGADESVRTVASGTVIDGSSRDAVAIGLTDRRVLCLSEGGTFVDVRYEYICSVRSWLASRITIRGNDHRLPVIGGALLAVVAFVGVGLYAVQTQPVSATVALGLALVTVLGTVSTEYDRRQRGTETVRQDPLTGGVLAGLVGVLAFVGIVVFVSIVVALLTLVALGGLALADYGLRHENEFDGIEIVPRREKNVAINTVDGRTVRVLVDSTAEFDRELGKLASTDAREAIAITSASTTRE